MAHVLFPSPPQSPVPGAHGAPQLPPGPGGLCGHLHPEPQPDGLWPRAYRECPLQVGVGAYPWGSLRVRCPPRRGRVGGRRVVEQPEPQDSLTISLVLFPSLFRDWLHPLPCLSLAPFLFLPPSLLLLCHSPNSVKENWLLRVLLPMGSLQGRRGAASQAGGQRQPPMSPAPATLRDPAKSGCLSSSSSPTGTPSG